MYRTVNAVPAMLTLIVSPSTTRSRVADCVGPVGAVPASGSGVGAGVGRAVGLGVGAGVGGGVGSGVGAGVVRAVGLGVALRPTVRVGRGVSRAVAVAVASARAGVPVLGGAAATPHALSTRLPVRRAAREIPFPRERGARFNTRCAST